MIQSEEFEDKLFSTIIERAKTGKKLFKEQIRKYVNIVDWIVNGIGLQSLYEHPREYQIIRDFFMLRCPKCNEKTDEDCFDKTIEEMKQEVLLELDYEKEIMVCPKCKYEVHRMKFNTLVLCVGMRGGKTVTASMIGTFIFYLTLVYPDVDKRLRLIPGQNLRASMVSTAAKQTEKTVWADFRSLLKNSIDSRISKIVGGTYEEREIDSHTKEWKVGNVDFMSLHSNSGSLAGGTGIFIVLEEYSRFNLGDSSRSADEVHAVLERSLKTTRSLAKTFVDDMFTLMVIISSPYYIANDPTMILIYGRGYKGAKIKYGKSERNNKLCYHYPTWEFNKFLTKELCAEDEDEGEDQYLFDRDYGANPLTTENRFFEYLDPINKSIVKDKGIAFDYSIVDIGKEKFWTAKVKKLGVMWGKEYCIHVDLGLSKDILSMVFSRVENGIAYIDGIMAIKPRKKIQVWIDTPYEIIKEVKDKIAIKFVSYDHWQSVSAIQNITKLGIQNGYRSVGEKELVSLKQLWYANSVVLVDNEDSDVLTMVLEEAQMLNRVNGKLSHTDILLSIAGSVTASYHGIDFKKVNKPVANPYDAFRNFEVQSSHVQRL